jgi:hypothetical protein
MQSGFRWWVAPAFVLTPIFIAAVVILVLYGPLLKTLIPLRATYPVRPSATIGRPVPHLFSYDDEVLRRNRERIQEGRAVATLRDAHQALLAEAVSLLAVGPFSVSDKPMGPGGGSVHDFYTLSPYFWPNGIIPGGKPYFYRDGIRNPEADSDRYDSVRLARFAHAVRVLSLAYYFSGEPDFAERASVLLRTWFLDSDTRMNPHLANAQAMPGWADGWNWGMIRLRDFAEATDAARIIQGSEPWSDADQIGLQQWYRSLLNWVADHPFGKREYRKPNNHGTWFDAAVAGIALFVGDEATARDLIQASAELRIERAIEPDGSQPQELSRSIPIHYSIFNLEALTRIAQIGERIGVDVWGFAGSEGQSIGSALRWLHRVLLEEGAGSPVGREVIEKDLDPRNRQKLLSILGAHQGRLEAAHSPVPAWIEELRDHLSQGLVDEGWEGVLLASIIGSGRD